MWDKIADSLKTLAPTAATLLGGPAAGMVVAGLSKILTGKDSADPEEIYQNLHALTPETVAQLKQLDVELAKINMQAEQNQLQADTAQQQQVNETIRTELATESKFKSYWRPVFGYAIGITWIVQTIGIIGSVLYVAIWQPQQAGTIIHAIEGLIAALATQWGIALAVLGVNIRQRSKDKEVVTGNFKPTIFQSVVDLIGSKNEKR